MIRFVLAAALCACTGVPQTPSGSAASEDATPAPLPTASVAPDEEDAAAQAMPEHHHHGGDHGGH